MIDPQQAREMAHPPPPGTPARVRITGWRPGLRKVSMTQTLRDETGMGLAAAKECTDRVLVGETVVVPVSDWAAAIRLAEALRALGAEARPEAEDARGAAAASGGPVSTPSTS